MAQHRIESRWRAPAGCHPEEIGALFAGFELIGPGLVTVHERGRPGPAGQGVVLAGRGRRAG